MARMLPDIDEATLRAFPRGRQAEAEVYRALRTLPADVVVLYSVQTLIRNGTLHEGEADFIILDPRQGVLFLEVKGGWIKYTAASDTWTSTDRDGNVHEIKDPMRQAADRKHDVWHLLRHRPTWPFHATVGHAALFPSLPPHDIVALNLPHYPREVVGGRDDLPLIEAWLSNALAAWRNPTDSVLGQAGVDTAVDVLRKDITIDVPTGVRLAAAEAHRLRLTQQQAAILEVIADRPVAAVLGGAGTGKSVLAFHEARRRSEAGDQVLLLCYNQLLGAHLARMCGGTRIRAMTLHQMYEWWVEVVDQRRGGNLLAETERGLPGATRDVTLPTAFAVAVSRRTPPAFTSIILDEGQDLCDEDWLAVDGLRAKLGARLVVFRDTNQALRRKTDYLPVPEDSHFRLRTNCRNTDPVHSSVYRFYQGPPVASSAIPGLAPSVKVAPTREAQAQVVRELVHSALTVGVEATQVAVLVLAKDDFKSAYFGLLPPLDPAMGAWGMGQHLRDGQILFDSVARFKGLEATTVVLWMGDDVDPTVHREWLYVGMSRAKSELHLVGTAAACAAALNGAPGGT